MVNIDERLLLTLYGFRFRTGIGPTNPPPVCPQFNIGDLFYCLGEQERSALIGLTGLIQGRLSTVIELDGESCSTPLVPAGCSVAPLSFNRAHFPPDDLQIRLDGHDDFSLTGWFPITLDAQEITRTVLVWLHEKNFRQVSIYDLSKLFKELGSEEIDWN